MDVCKQTELYHTATQMRLAGLAVESFWMAFVAVRGMRDVHNMPYSVGRYATLNFIQQCTSMRSSHWQVRDCCLFPLLQFPLGKIWQAGGLPAG